MSAPTKTKKTYPIRQPLCFMRISATSLIVAVTLGACQSIPYTSEENPANVTAVTTEATVSDNLQDVTEVTDMEEASDTVSDNFPQGNDLIRPRSREHTYTHSEDGYFNLPENGIEFKMFGQVSGTCWVCASACAMMTAYQFHHDGTIELDQINLLNAIYDNDKDEGLLLSEGVDERKFGGCGIFVVNELSQGFGDGLVLDTAILAQNWTPDEIKAGIRTYGALYIGIPDTDQSLKGYYDNYYTMNFPDAELSDFDHSIAVLGWDDHFPKEYFRKEASQDGAWITFNSNFPTDYYYISYDTPFDQEGDLPFFLSVTDLYSDILSHDCGCWSDEPVCTGDVTTTANVFHGEGTLAAVGTYSLTDDQDLTIQILTPDLNECLYTQEAHIDFTGYHVIPLDQPMEVTDYAIAISYPKGAPVEGESFTLDRNTRVDIISERGQSFIRIDDTWVDMSEEAVWQMLDRVTNNACIRALYW